MKNLKLILFFFFISVLITTSSYAQTKTQIPADSLPSAVHDELHKKYRDYKVNSISRKSEQNKITYALEIQKKTKLIRLLYDSDGKLIEKDKSKIFIFDASEPVKSKPVQSNDGHNHHH